MNEKNIHSGSPRLFTFCREIRMVDPYPYPVPSHRSGPPRLLARADITDILFIFSLFTFHFLLPCAPTNSEVTVLEHPRPSFNFYFLGKHLDIQLRSVIFCRHIRRQLVAAPGGQQKTFCADQAVCSCEVWHRGPISYFTFFYFDSWTEGLKFLSKFRLRHVEGIFQE